MLAVLLWPLATQPTQTHILLPDDRLDCEQGGLGCKGFETASDWLARELNASTYEYLQPNNLTALDERIGIILQSAADPRYHTFYGAPSRLRSLVAGRALGAGRHLGI